MAKILQPNIQLLYTEARLVALFLALDELHSAASEDRLDTLTTVSKVELVNGASHGGDGKYVTVALRPKESYDVREEVARTVIQHGWPLREIRLEHATLEEFFVEVTAQQAAAKA